MKTNKWLITLLLLTLVCSTLLAEEEPRKVFAYKNTTHALGLQLGYARPILREKDLANPEAKKMLMTDLNGFTLGFLYTAKIVKGFGTTIGVDYTAATKMGRWTAKDMPAIAGRERTTYEHQTFDLQVNMQYKFEIAMETYLILYTGPVADYTVRFRKRYQWEPLNPELKKPGVINTDLLDQDTDNDGITDYTPWNVTWGVGLGFQYQRFFLRGGYNFGIYSPYMDKFNDILRKYNHGRFDQWQITIGIYLAEF